jgi:hypothetical protein
MSWLSPDRSSHFPRTRTNPITYSRARVRYWLDAGVAGTDGGATRWRLRGIASTGHVSSVSPEPGVSDRFGARQAACHPSSGRPAGFLHGEDVRIGLAEGRMPRPPGLPLHGHAGLALKLAKRSIQPPPPMTAHSDPGYMPYSVWESNHASGHLILEPPGGILVVSLPSDGLQKSDADREREAEMGASCFHSKRAGASGRPMVGEGRNAQNGPARASIGVWEGARSDERTARQRFARRRMVEAVGIEPTSDGQSPQTTTSVSCVLGSRRRRPQAGLPRR